MPLYEIETTAHIIITWAASEEAASEVVREAYPTDEVIRLTKTPPRHVGHFESGLGDRRRGRSLQCRPRLPLKGSGRQSACHSALYARNRLRSARRSEGHRVQHGDGLVAVSA